MLCINTYTTTYHLDLRTALCCAQSMIYLCSPSALYLLHWHDLLECFVLFELTWFTCALHKCFVFCTNTIYLCFAGSTQCWLESVCGCVHATSHRKVVFMSCLGLEHLPFLCSAVEDRQYEQRQESCFVQSLRFFCVCARGNCILVQAQRSQSRSRSPRRYVWKWCWKTCTIAGQEQLCWF